MLFRRWRGFVLADPREPLRDYWVTVTVAFPEPIAVTDPEPGESPHIVGYIRLLGVRSAPLELRSIIGSAVEDGGVVWERTEWKPIRLKDLDRTIRKRIVPIDSSGIWYQSGRIFFPDWTDDEDADSG